MYGAVWLIIGILLFYFVGSKTIKFIENMIRRQLTQVEETFVYLIIGGVAIVLFIAFLNTYGKPPSY